MEAVVIDASIASAWCFPDEQTNYTDAVFQVIASSAWDAVAPRLWEYEIRNSVLMGLRRGRISKQDSEQFLAELDALNIRLIDPASYDQVFDLAQVHGLTVYDASYLSIAMEGRLPLASLDKKLVRAAEAAGVLLFQI
jgi:predicted nucleic acid-binding protein